MKRANAVLFSLLMIASSLAGCIGGEEFDSSDLEQQIADLEKNQELMNQTIIAQQNENDELRASMEMMNQTILAMNQTLVEQSSINAEIQQALEDMNASNAEDVQNLLSTIVRIQINTSLSQTAIYCIVDELENMNSSDSDLLAQLNATQNYLDSLESDLNITIASLISEIDWANDTARWLNSSYKYFIGANLNSINLEGADLRYAVFTGALLINAKLNHADLRFANFTDANLANADLRGANLYGANMSNSTIHGIDWTDAICPNGDDAILHAGTCEHSL